ncbi:MAG: hypothetical protein RLY86_4214 [Pseudomonadota bacterium]|jgi:hypothetical protein
MAQALATVARIAREVDAGLPLAPGGITVAEDGSIEVRREPAASRHHFFLDGLLFHISLTPTTDPAGNPSTLYQIWAEVGYMPYTIESPEKRARLAAILRASHWLKRARFVLDDKQKILVLAQQDVAGSPTLADMMYETVQFLQEARPYLRVFGQYL